MLGRMHTFFAGRTPQQCGSFGSCVRTGRECPVASCTGLTRLCAVFDGHVRPPIRVSGYAQKGLSIKCRNNCECASARCYPQIDVLTGQIVGFDPSFRRRSRSARKRIVM